MEIPNGFERAKHRLQNRAERKIPIDWERMVCLFKNIFISCSCNECSAVWSGCNMKIKFFERIFPCIHAACSWQQYALYYEYIYRWMRAAIQMRRCNFCTPQFRLLGIVPFAEQKEKHRFSLNRNIAGMKRKKNRSKMCDRWNVSRSKQKW